MLDTLDTFDAILKPQWPAPSNVHAFTTTRTGGISQPPFDSNNLGLHVGDNEASVQHNRQLLISNYDLPSPPEWLEQTHSNQCVIVEETTCRSADAALTRQAGRVLTIMTADCLPIMLCNTQGTEVAAIHAGWRGLANGIIGATLEQMHSDAHNLLAWIGPSICQDCYETGDEVRQAFTSQFPFTDPGFYVKNHRTHANLPGLAELILHNHGVKSVYQSNQCTYESNHANHNKYKYYSYRHEKQTGRIATLIWFK